MNRSTRVRGLQLACALALAVVIAPSAALAASGPALSPRQILSEGFETAPPSNLTLDWVFSTDPISAYWGRITQQKHSGSYGLWCAGSIPNGAIGTGWTAFGGFYPSYTGGLADFSVPDLSDYYSATLEYWYRMPSLGSQDGDSFNVLWQPASNAGGGLWDYHDGWPAMSLWTHVTLDLTAAAPHRYNLSRTAGTVRFLFMDSAGSFGENPTNGEGPTIDDVSITGYTYGPVRNLGATVDGSGAHLSWTVPARSTVPGAPDEDRPVAYRIFRELDGSNAWTELTTDRSVTGTTFDDTDTSALAGTYRYVVQAWDTGAGTGYGQVALAGDTTTHFFAGPPSAPQFTITSVPIDPTKLPVTPGYSTTSTETPAPTVSATLDGAAFTMGDAVSAEGTHTLIVRLTGGGGTSERSAVFVIDHTAPSTTNNLPATGTVSLAPVMIVLNATDNVSGVAFTKYSLDGGAFTTCSGGVLVSAWRDHTINYYSVDLAGNVELQHHIHFSMRQPTTLSIAYSTLSPTHGHPISLSGYLAPGGANYKLTLKYQKPGSSRWYSVTRYTVKAGSRGKWTYKYTPAKKGTYHFKISYAGSTTKYRSNSTVLAIPVR